MSIKKKLEIVIKSINNFSKQTNMVAINAAIYASRLNNSQGAPFLVLAKEIQNMSSQSIDKLEELDQLMQYINDISALVNKVGSQRMLIMQMVVGNTMDNSDIFKESVRSFESNLELIRDSSLNTPKIQETISLIEAEWVNNKEDMMGTDTKANFDRATRMVALINNLLDKYEELTK